MTVVDNIKPISTFIGPNKAGKSSIIEVLQTLTGLSKNVLPRPFIELVRGRDLRLKISIGVDIQFSEEDRRRILDFFPDSSKLREFDSLKTSLFSRARIEVTLNRHAIHDEKLMLSDDQDNLITVIDNNTEHGPNPSRYAYLDKIVENARDPSAFRMARATHEQQWSHSHNLLSHPESAVEFKIASMIRKFFGEIIIFPAYRRPMVTHAFTPADSMLPDGSNLVVAMNNLQTRRPSVFTKIMGTFGSIIGDITETTAPTLPGSSDITAMVTENGVREDIDLANISTGMQQLLVLVFGIERAPAGTIICIEEPEIHLHSGAQKKLFNLIRKKAESNQIFITTHSPVFTALESDISTFLVTKTDGISKVSNILDYKDLRFFKHQLGLHNSDAYAYDYVVFVEGDSEELALPMLAPALGFEQFGKSVALINFGGKGKARRLTEFLRYLKNFETKSIVVADGHAEIKEAIKDAEREGLLLPNHAILRENEFEDLFELGNHLGDAKTG